jgi:hypothetical protein
MKKVENLATQFLERTRINDDVIYAALIIYYTVEIDLFLHRLQVAKLLNFSHISQTVLQHEAGDLSY